VNTARKAVVYQVKFVHMRMRRPLVFPMYVSVNQTVVALVL